MFDFSKRLERTFVGTQEVSKDNIIKSNVSFLNGKSLLEFGVFSGYTLRYFSNLYDHFNMDKIFFGFDSFSGLPKEESDLNNPDYWNEGAFTGYSKVYINQLLPFVNVKEGWFKDTLNDETLVEVKKHQIGLVHIDCDIYTSTMDVLEWLVKNDLLIEGMLIMYDDWGGHYKKGVGEYECGEGKAHKEICEKYRLEFELVSCDVIQKDYWEICTFRYLGKM